MPKRKTLNCICCNKSISQIQTGLKNTKEITSGLWNDAIVDEISGGFGSSHDGDKFSVAICDACVEEKKKTKQIIFTGRYF